MRFCQRSRSHACASCSLMGHTKSGSKAVRLSHYLRCSMSARVTRAALISSDI